MAAFGRYAITPNFGIPRRTVGTEFYMLADSRLVGSPYLTVRPPRGFATPAVPVPRRRRLPACPNRRRHFETRVFLGQSGEEAPAAAVLDLWGSAHGAYLDYQTGHWQWRLTYAQIKFKDDIRDSSKRSGPP